MEHLLIQARDQTILQELCGKMVWESFAVVGRLAAVAAAVVATSSMVVCVSNS
jgi:hypothetical protein